MRTPLARLVGLAAAGSLILSPLAVAGPANAAGPGGGNLSVTIVDELGQPVKALVQLIPSGGDPFTLGATEPTDDDPGALPVASSSFSEDVPPETYGAIAVGGWAGLTCVGLANCSVMALMGAAGGANPLGAGTFTVGDSGTTALTITVATPKLNGTPGIGQPLSVSVPSSLTDMGSMLASLPGSPLAGQSSEPIVTWNRNGAPFEATGKAYTPTTADAGSTISATVNLPQVMATYYGAMPSGTTPGPFTTAGVSIKKLTPSIKLSVPGKVKQGKRPAVYVNVTFGSALVGGVVTFAVDKLRPQQAVLRSGLATFKLPKLKPGKHKVTASFAAVGAYNAAKTTKTVVVKGKKPKKGKKKK